MRRRSDFATIVVFVAALSVFVPWIGAQEIWSKDEARTALIVKEMLATGDWSLARVPGGAYSRKPPLYHWLTTLAAWQGLDEVALRLPAAVAAASTAALTYLVGAQLATPAVGLVAAAILIASPSFFEWARIARMDTLLVFFITLSLWGLGRWLLLGGRGNGLLFGMGVGFAVLTKGPAGLLPVAVAALAVTVRPSRPGSLRELGPGLALALGLPLAWLASAALAAPDFTRYALSLGPTIADELIRPTSSALSGALELAVGFFPWTLLLPGSFVVLVRHRILPSPLLTVSLGWLIVVLVIFLAAISPRAVYFLPAYPALALLAASGWQAADSRERRWLTAPLGLGMVAVIAAGLVNAVWLPTLRFHGDPLQVSPRIGLITSGALLLVGVVAFWLERHGRTPSALAVLAVGAVTTLLVVHVGVRTPFYNQLYPVRAIVKRLEASIPPGAETGYTEANRGTALAVYLSRPLRQLPSSVVAGQGLPSSVRYVLLSDVEFQTVRQTWSLQRVDDVFFHNVRYVLAMVAERPARLSH